MDGKPFRDLRRVVFLARRNIFVIRLVRMTFAVVFPARPTVITASFVTGVWYLPGSLIAQAGFRHGIIAALTQRITAQNAPYRQDQTNKKAPFLKRLQRVSRAAGHKATARPTLRGRYKPSVKAIFFAKSFASSGKHPTRPIPVSIFR